MKDTESERFAHTAAEQSANSTGNESESETVRFRWSR